MYQSRQSGVTESYCSDKEWKNPGVSIGSWVNTNAQVLDFEFHLEVPLHEDNALYVAGLYYYSGEDYPEYDYPYDYDAYMADMAELNKFELHFKCVKVEESIPEDGFQIDAS